MAATFSYRKSKPSYYAARSAVRRYKRRFGTDNLLLIDFAAYSDFIDHNILIKKLEDLNFTSKVIDLLKLFIDVKVFNQNRKPGQDYGLMQGVPLIALFANIYCSTRSLFLEPNSSDNIALPYLYSSFYYLYYRL